MTKEITSKIIGKLKQEAGFRDWWKSDIITIPFFDNSRLSITFADFEPKHDKTFIDEADQALTNFLELNENDRNQISELAYNNRKEFLGAVGPYTANDPLEGGENKNEIWKLIHPTEIYVKRRPYGEQDIYVQISCECDWEEEHGLQLVFRQGKKLTRISGQDGHLTDADAYGRPDEEDELLSTFNR